MCMCVCVHLARAGEVSDQIVFEERHKLTASKKVCERLREQRAKRTSESDKKNIYGVKIGAAH